MRWTGRGAALAWNGLAKGWEGFLAVTVTPRPTMPTRIFSFAAVQRSPSQPFLPPQDRGQRQGQHAAALPEPQRSGEQLVGFVTARVVYMRECDAVVGAPSPRGLHACSLR